jgi:hypothetical protein
VFRRVVRMQRAGNGERIEAAMSVAEHWASTFMSEAVPLGIEDGTFASVNGMRAAPMVVNGRKARGVVRRVCCRRGASLRRV